MDWTRWIFVGFVAWLLVSMLFAGLFCWRVERNAERREFENVGSLERMASHDRS